MIRNTVILLVLLSFLAVGGLAEAGKAGKEDKTTKAYDVQDIEAVYDAIVSFVESSKWVIEDERDDRRGNIILVIYKKAGWTNACRLNIKIDAEPNPKGLTEVRIVGTDNYQRKKVFEALAEELKTRAQYVFFPADE